jgi:hypothetical protein
VSRCDVTINDPSVIISHDSVLNLGHMFEDILNVWLTIMLNNDTIASTKFINLISIDGLRPGNILQGAGHHILDTLYIDSLGLFHQIYDVLFKKVISAAQLWGPRKDYRDSNTPGKRVCFTKPVYFYPMPLKAFLWDKFEVLDPCSLKLRVSRSYKISKNV